MKENKRPHILIVGGGFAGIATALRLSKKSNNTRITLISSNPHFEYYPALYKVATGKSPLGATIQLDAVLKNSRVEIVQDKIIQFTLNQNTIKGESGSLYTFDYLIIALGSETVYFNIPGLAEYSYSFKSIDQALKLKNHLHTLLSNHSEAWVQDLDKHLRVVVCGGGASGVELAGELVGYFNQIAKCHEVNLKHVEVMLVEGNPRILPMLDEKISKRVTRRLLGLGVKVVTGQAITHQEEECVYTTNMSIPTKTVVWTAGVKINSLYQGIEGLQFSPKGRVLVDEHLRARGFSNVFIAGDAADTKYSGFAQTALYDGNYIAKTITQLIKDKTPRPYIPKDVVHALPIARGWGIVSYKKYFMMGPLGYILRRLADFDFFIKILPLRQAINVMTQQGIQTELCINCKSDIYSKDL